MSDLAYTKTAPEQMQLYLRVLKVYQFILNCNYFIKLNNQKEFIKLSVEVPK